MATDSNISELLDLWRKESDQPLPMGKKFSLQELRVEIAVVIFLHLRITGIFSSENKVLALLDINEKFDVVSSRLEDLEIGAFEAIYSAIEKTTIGRCLEQQYQFAYNGITHECPDHLGQITPHSDPLEELTTHTDVAGYIESISSRHVAQWDAVHRLYLCDRVCELANARVALEMEGVPGGFAVTGGYYEAENENGLLSVRQMALLAGMKEMSIRTAMSRPGENQLRSVKKTPNGQQQIKSTFIEKHEAIRWLKAKNLYVPIVRHRETNLIKQLSSSSFNSLEGLIEFITRGLNFAANSVGADGSAENSHETRDLLKVFTDRPVNNSIFSDKSAMENVAEAIGVPSKLLMLRAAEITLSEKLSEVQVSIRTEADKAADDRIWPES